jgi:HSP20 family protein
MEDIMAVTRWDPVRDLIQLQSRLNTVFGQNQVRGDDEAYGAWSPPVDIFEKGDDLVLHVELPGVSREDIDVRVQEGTLVLNGERRRSGDVEEGRSYRLERVFGPFSRRFVLPTIVDAGRISARLGDGVLEIRLPKAEEAKPRKIQIDAR